MGLEADARVAQARAHAVQAAAERAAADELRAVVQAAVGEAEARLHREYDGRLAAQVRSVHGRPVAWFLPNGVNPCQFRLCPC